MMETFEQMARRFCFIEHPGWFGCQKCPILNIARNHCFISMCIGEGDTLEQQIELVRKWAAEHPREERETGNEKT